MVGETVDGGGYGGVGGGCSDGCEAADGSGDGQIVSQMDLFCEERISYVCWMRILLTKSDNRRLHVCGQV